MEGKLNHLFFSVIGVLAFIFLLGILVVCALVCQRLCNPPFHLIESKRRYVDLMSFVSVKIDSYEAKFTNFYTFNERKQIEMPQIT